MTLEKSSLTRFIWEDIGFVERSAGLRVETFLQSLNINSGTEWKFQDICA